jgi:glycosyltransferase involved in cell wall biosynthesis
MTRVLVVHSRYRTAEPSGENRVVDQEIDLLRGHDHEVEVFERCSDDIASFGALDKALLPAHTVWSPAEAARVTATVRAFRPDVVHVHNTFPLLSPSVVRAIGRSRVPVVATLHNYRLMCASSDLYRDGAPCADCLGHLPVPAVRHRCYRQSIVASLSVAALIAVGAPVWVRNVSLFVAISASQRALLVQGGLPAERTIVKHNFLPDPGACAGPPGDYMLSLGRLAPEKGLDLLMGAWDTARGAGPLPGRLVIAGGGPLAAVVESWAQDRPDVEYVGLRSPAECARLVAGARAVVVTSRHAEPFGMVAVEAMAAATPCLAPDAGAFPELLTDGAQGLLYPAGDAPALAAAVRRLLTDDGLARRLGAAGRRHYEEAFSPEAGLHALEAVYARAQETPCAA